MVIFGAIFLLTTLLILYSSNSSNDIIYGSIHVAGRPRTVKTTDLKKWAGKEGYVPVYGNKVGLYCAELFTCFTMRSPSGPMNSAVWR